MQQLIGKGQRVRAYGEISHRVASSSSTKNKLVRFKYFDYCRVFQHLYKCRGILHKYCYKYR